MIRFSVRHRIPAAIAGVVLAAVSCRDATSPANSTRISVDLGPVPAPVFGTDTAGNPTIECDPTFQAVAAGEGSATWGAALVRFYWGTDRTVARDSVTISAADIADAWGAAEISAGGTASSRWKFVAPEPFAAELVFAYESASKSHSDGVTLECGPAVKSSTPAPVVAPPTFTAPANGIQPGDTLMVGINASAAAQLWQIQLRLTGACSALVKFPGQLATSLARTVPMVIPPGCRLGAELGLEVTAIDAGVRATSATAATGLTVTDTRPPTLAPSIWAPRRSASLPPDSLTGTWFPGDTLRVTYGASDNDVVSMLHWEETTSGVQDSVPAAGATDVKVGIRPEWVGSVGFRFWVTDRAGLTSDTASTVAGRVAIAPIVPRSFRSMSLGGYVDAIAYDAGRQRLYVAQKYAKRVAVVDIASMTLVDSIALSDGPVALDLVPSGDSLLVVLPDQRSLAVVDLRATAPIVSTLNLTPLDTASWGAPVSVRVLANNEVLVGTIAPTYPSNPNSPTIMEVDLTTGAQRFRPDANRGGHPAYGIAISGDRRVAVLAEGCTQHYVLATDSFSPCLAVSYDGPYPTVDATGATTAIAYRLYDASLALVRTVPSIYGPLAGGQPGLSPDGAVLYGADSQLGLVRYRTSDGTVLDASPSGVFPRGIFATPDGRWVVIFDSEARSTIAVVAAP